MKRPAGDATGRKASLTLFEHGDRSAMLFALITVATPAKATRGSLRPAAPRSIQRWRACGRSTVTHSLCRRVSVYSPSSQPVLVLLSFDNSNVIEAACQRDDENLSRPSGTARISTVFVSSAGTQRDAPCPLHPRRESAWEHPSLHSALSCSH